jgi:hypothetical protein
MGPWRIFALREEEMEEVRRSRSREYEYDEEGENLTKRPSNEAALAGGLRREKITTLDT